MKLKIILILCCVYLGRTLNAQSPLTLYPTDAMVELCVSTQYSFAATSNYSTDPRVIASDWSANDELWMKSYLKLDLSGIPCGAVISHVDLYLYGEGMHYNSGSRSNASFLMRTITDWAVNTITWNTQPTTTTVNTATLANSTSVAQNYVVDITQLVKDMMTNPGQGNGLLFQLQNYPVGQYSRMSFYSNDYSVVAKRPRVVITYTGGTYIVSAPLTKAACLNTSVTFNVSATGSGTLSYQWRKGGATISGATASSYTITAIVATDAANYDVVVTSDCGSVTSAPATLTLINSPVINIQPVAVSLWEGSSTTFSVTATCAGPLLYQWRKNGVNISGATSTNFTINSVGASDVANYDVVISNSCGLSVTSSIAALTLNIPPTITTQPLSVTACIGSSLSLNVIASGTNIKYSWRKAGIVIPGATSSVFTIDAVKLSDVGTYDVYIEETGWAGSLTSSPAQLTVNELNAPSNLTVESISTTQIKLSWSSASNNCEDGFKVEKRIGASDFIEIAVVPANTTYFTDTNVNTDNPIVYRVRTFRGIVYSNYSTEILFSSQTLININTISIECNFTYSINVGGKLSINYPTGTSESVGVDNSITSTDVMVHINTGAGNVQSDIKFHYDKVLGISNLQILKDASYVSLSSDYFQITDKFSLTLFGGKGRVFKVQNQTIVLKEGILLTPMNTGFFDVFKINGLESVTQFRIRIYNLSDVLVFDSTDKTTSWNGKASGTGLLVPKGVYKYLVEADANTMSGQFIIDYP